MTQSNENYGPAAYGNFYRPLTDRLRQRGIDSIGGGQGGFTGRWRTFHSGFDNIVYILALDDEGRDSAGLVFRDADKHGPIFESLRSLHGRIQVEMPTADIVWESADWGYWVSVRKDADSDIPIPERERTREWMFLQMVDLKNALQLRLCRAIQQHSS